MIENEENFLLLKDLFPESWGENPEFSKYINELCSFGIVRLYNEPSNLAEERSQILSETQKLAFNNYKTFIQTADCSKEVFQEFQIFETHLDEMLIKLPKLQNSYSKFISEAAHINSNRKLNSTTLSKHPQLLEILELPQLMDTCVRNSYYDEALELAEYSRRLANKLSNIPVICNIVDEIKGSMDMMLGQLLGQLRQDLQLPTCLRVIGYLRRINVFTELELRLKFLQIRGEWLKSSLNSIQNDDPFHHISKTIELSRVHLFDIVTQYRAIFSDDEFVYVKDIECDNSALFHSWIALKISEFLETLETDIGRGIGNHLDSLLGQCMYFGLSFGRVGLDFRNLMVPLFQKAAKKMLATSVESAERKLEESLKVYSLLGGSGSSPNFILPPQSANNLQAPAILMEYPPLAVYCNDLLLAFNDLRLCMPLSIVIDTASILQKSLANVSTFILTFHRVDESTFNTKELELFGRLCDVFSNHLLPFINVCLNCMFPPTQLSQVAAISPSDITKTMVGMLDIEAIISPIKHLIPQINAHIPVANSVHQFNAYIDKDANINESSTDDNIKVNEDLTNHNRVNQSNELNVNKSTEISDHTTEEIPHSKYGITIKSIDDAAFSENEFDKISANNLNDDLLANGLTESKEANSLINNNLNVKIVKREADNAKNDSLLAVDSFTIEETEE